MSENESFSAKVDINGSLVWYERFGFGPKTVLLIPGAIGTGRSDYWPQLFGEDAYDLEKYTFIAVEAPGWGRSSPPARKYGLNVYNNDAECFHQLMKHLGYTKYPVIAWSDGCKSALTMATKYPDVMSALIMCGADVTGSQTAVNFLNDTIKVNTWGQERIGYYLRSYETVQQIQDLWTKYVNFTKYISTYFTTDMFANKYHLIRCPVLLLQAEYDRITDTQQCLHMKNNIKQCKHISVPSYGHDFHLKNPLKFKRLTEDLLSKC